MKLPLITDIQKYSIHDGNGIRTTIFFKGCPLSCLWCHNPETQLFSKQLLFQSEKCTGCQSWIKPCPLSAITIADNKVETNNLKCDKCGVCTEYCLMNAREIAGRYYTINELIEVIDKDKMFYEQSDGGVTLSGGEVFSQNIEYLEELLSKLNEKGYSVNVDTSGYAPFPVMKRLLKYIDTFLYDIKVMDNDLHRRYTGVDNHLILDNLKLLSAAGALIWLRLPVIGGVNDTDENIEQTAKYLAEEKIVVKQINLLPYHNTGSGKYQRLQWDYGGTNFTVPETNKLENFSGIFKRYGLDNIKIGG